MNALNTKAWVGLICVTSIIGILLFVTAGTIDYWQAWVFLAVYFASSLLITLYLMKNDPALLRRRMSGGPAAEKEKAQKIIMFYASCGFVATLVVSALDRRFMWSHESAYVVIAGDVLIALAFYIWFLVFRENSFASSIVATYADQRVISTGPYALVRHPMYAGGLLLFAGMPLALGSYRGLIPVVAVVPALIWRLVDEEKLLMKDLPGYAEYRTRIRWRLVPGIF